MRSWQLYAALLSLLSLALIWMGSLFWDILYVGNRTVFAATAGAAELVVLRPDLTIDGGIPWMQKGWQVERRRREHLKWLPLMHRDDPFRSTFTVWLTVPLWIPTLCLAGFALFLWRIRRQRGRIGFCECGYDLTGNVSGVCPECGRAAAHFDRA